MKNPKKTLTIVGLLFLVQILFQSTIPIAKADTSIPVSYYQDLSINGTYVYNVTQFGNEAGWYNFTPWPDDSYEGQWKTNTGGQIIVNFTGFYDKDPNDWGNIFGDPIPWLDIEIIENNLGILTTNFTLANRSNSEVARALTLGFNYFQSGFLIPTQNLTHIKELAANQSNPGGLFDIVGDVTIEETYNFFYIGFEQAGGQQTYMTYDRETGLLVWAKTSIFGYLIEIESLNFTKNYLSSLTYDVNQFGGEIGWFNFTPWPDNSYEGQWKTSKGGQIIVNSTGFYNKDPNDWGNAFNDPIAWFDIEIFENSSGVLNSNFTLYNRSNSEIAWALTLGYNNFQPGFHIKNIENLTRVKGLALQEASGGVPGIVTNEETDLTLKITFEQVGGGQKTSLIYEKRTGILLWTNTTFASYLLEMVIEGYSPWESDEVVAAPRPNYLSYFLPYLIIISISMVSAFSILAASKFNKKIRKINKYFLIGIIAAASFASFFVYTTSVEIPDVNEPLKEVHDITLIVDYGNGTIRTHANFTLNEYNTTAFHALVEWCEVQYKGFGEQGILVEEIDGLRGNWRYFINGDYSRVSSDKYNLKNGDIVKWVFG